MLKAAIAKYGKNQWYVVHVFGMFESSESPSIQGPHFVLAGSQDT